MNEPAAYLLYDGECPMCSRYVRMLRLRQTLPGFTLLDAREHADLVAAHRAEGRDINAGMIMRVGGAYHVGSEALIAIAGLSTRSGFLNRVNAKLFSSPAASRLIYPWLVGGRNLLLRLMQRRQIA